MVVARFIVESAQKIHTHISSQRGTALLTAKLKNKK